MLRSLLFMILFFCWTALWAVVLLPFPLLPQGWRYWGCGTWARVASRLFLVCLRVRLTVKGLQHLPGAPFVLLSNHQSTLETLLLWSFFPQLSFVLKKELLRIPLFGWYLPLAQPIAIDRKAGPKALHKVLTEGEKRLRGGIPVLLFPEGTRQPCGTLGKFHQTGAALARQAGVPIVPLALNTGCFWPRHGFRKRSGDCHLHFGPPIAPEGSSGQLTTQVRDWIAAELQTMPAP
ncbi:MAG: 1-acyl-sn-glycerol-3-phosphate acyltransferase [Acidithiobacillus sp.]|nr:1-acyl-sn-glycerol-3-phosphate acyltransferase [Acidithiobacillus sp.]